MISQVELLGQGEEFLARRPVAVFGEDFAQHAGRLQAGHPGQIDGALGVAGPAQHAAFLGHQEGDVAGPDEIAGLARRIDDRQDRRRPLRRRDARAAVRWSTGTVKAVPSGAGVFLDHRPQFEPLAKFPVPSKWYGPSTDRKYFPLSSLMAEQKTMGAPYQR